MKKSINELIKQFNKQLETKMIELEFHEKRLKKVFNSIVSNYKKNEVNFEYRPFDLGSHPLEYSKVDVPAHKNKVIDSIAKKLRLSNVKLKLSSALQEINQICIELSDEYCKIYNLIMIEQDTLKFRGFTIGSEFVDSENFSMPTIEILNIESNQIRFKYTNGDLVKNETLNIYSFICKYGSSEETEASKKRKLREKNIDSLLY
jgi:hypothetical protein